MYNVNIVLSIVSANVNKNIKSVLSLSQDKIYFPNFSLLNCDDIFLDIKNKFVEYFQDPALDNYVNQMFLIDVNSHNLNNIFSTNNTINILYGITIPMLKLKNNYYWYNFEFSDLSIPNELSIIGETIRRGF
jgi:hypothetical protein